MAVRGWIGGDHVTFAGRVIISKDTRSTLSTLPWLPKKPKLFPAHAEAIAALLYEEADPEQLTTLAGIEKTVRDQVLDHVTPHIGVFLSARQQEQS